MRSSKWQPFKKCRQGIITVAVIFFVLQILNSLLYVYLLETSSKVVQCKGYGHVYEEDNEVNNTDLESVNYFQLQVNRKTALILGHFRQNKSYLTIGIPTVWRKGVSYLDGTLSSLIKNTHENERQEIVLAIYLADQNQTWIRKTAYRLKHKYANHLKSGFMQVFYYRENLFPDFKSLPRTFNDTQDRVKWRSKQNIDYAFMFMYCKNISYYYMQLEDDVEASPDYFANMKFFISNANLQKEWFCLEFSNLGFLGKLVRSSDLQEIANFLLMFYWDQPADNLFNYLKQIKTQFTDIRRRPSLFQHKGVISSLTGKHQFLQDSSAKRSFSRKRFYNLNPRADVSTNIETFEDHTPEKAYDLSDDYFWGMSPKKGDQYFIKFLNLENITRLYIGFGLPQRSNDIFYNCDVKISQNCKDWSIIGKANGNLFDTDDQNIYLPANVKCIILNVTANQSNWVVIREISVFRKGDVVIENPSHSSNKNFDKVQFVAQELRNRMQNNPIYAQQMQKMHFNAMQFQEEIFRKTGGRNNKPFQGMPAIQQRFPAANNFKQANQHPDQIRRNINRIPRNRMMNIQYKKKKHH
ncbi:alpha-1,3-mannosylglycoprotein beta-1,4-N-acetylglucosaminyltransferase C [Mytilus galloprovincialis]|uniref:Alpha-1,3-mannosylglycoprotein beta-1,4-N-acetylglucosaminyltransferase C n=1 Tax=Mytilus galloprovincialis TaxID=29158 RepID=A0A8B6H6M8_MYTGA|nr:alpha-1,3-mannosylglycoprotein beta-1,4-N-acetylglucosaminyltransferase C [Mytilus galloprovincialis]